MLLFNELFNHGSFLDGFAVKKMGCWETLCKQAQNQSESKKQCLTCINEYGGCRKRKAVSYDLKKNFSDKQMPMSMVLIRQCKKIGALEWIN